MKHPELWKPSKVVWNGSRRRYEANPAYVSLGSRFAVDQMAGPYQRVIESHARGRLLDCGCGDVPYYQIYAPHVRETTCIDWSRTLHGLTHLDVEVDLTGPLPFDPGSFDTVLLADVLEHIPEPWQLLQEVARVLAPDGKAIILVPFLYRLHETPHDYYRYTEFGLQRLCRRAGLELMEVEPFGGYPDVLFDLLNKALSPLAPLCRAFLAAARWFSRTTVHSRWREKTQRIFPLGYCAVARKPPAGTPDQA